MSASSINGADRALNMLRGVPGALSAAVSRTVAGFGLDVVAAAKRNAPLKTGRLRRSIHLEMFREQSGVRGVVGTNVEYAGVFEHGLKGTQPVREFVRKQTMAWGHPITPVFVSVRPFTRNVNRAARPFLQPALEGTTPSLSERLRADLRAIPGVGS